MDNTLRVSNEREWAPPVALVNRTLYYSVALDYFAKQAAAREQGEAYWIRSPGKKNFLLVDKSPQHISLNRVFRTAAVLATASVFTRPRDPNTANRCVTSDKILCFCHGVCSDWATRCSSYV